MSIKFCYVTFSTNEWKDSVVTFAFYELIDCIEYNSIENY